MQCVGPAVAHWLRLRNHDVLSVYEKKRGMSDAEIIAKAYEDDRILITIDKDFGARIFRENRPHRGVVLLRLENECAPAKIAAIQRLLDNHSERLAGNFVVVTGSRVRFARSR